MSCYNREREFTSGRNAKGTAPTMAPLLPRSVRYAVENGPVLVYSSPLCADTLELMMAVLRTTRGRAQFGFHGRTRARQQILFSLRTIRQQRRRLARRAMHNAALAAGTVWLLEAPTENASQARFH